LANEIDRKCVEGRESHMTERQINRIATAASILIVCVIGMIVTLITAALW